MRVLAATLLASTLLAVDGGSALAHYALKADPVLAAWFHSLRNPRTGASCCDQSDGHILAEGDWRTAGDGYEVRIDGSWVPVPRNTVLSHVRNPTGSAVVFYLPDTTDIDCFVRPPEA